MYIGDIKSELKIFVYGVGWGGDKWLNELYFCNDYVIY